MSNNSWTASLTIEYAGLVKITLLTLVLVLSFPTAKAQKNEPSKPKSEIPTVAFCDLLRKHEMYAGKEVRFRAVYILTFELSAFSRSDCEKDEYSWVEFDHASMRSSTKPEKLKKFDRMMMRYVDDQWATFNTEMLVTGILDNSESGHGHLDRYRFSVKVNSIEDIGETKKIVSK